MIPAFNPSSAPAEKASATPESPSPALHKVADHVFPRRGATLFGVALGILLGMGNVVIGLIFPSWLTTLGLLAAAILSVVVLHEGLHGATAWIFGYRPIFGVEPPSFSRPSTRRSGAITWW